MDELAIRLELLKAELGELQEHIRANHVATYQVRGWAVTVGLAAAGLVLSGRYIVSALGVIAAVLFAGLEGHIRLGSGTAIDRVREIEDRLDAPSAAAALTGENPLKVPWLAHSLRDGTVHGWARLGSVFRTAVRPGTIAIYLGLMGLQVGALVTALATLP